MIQCFQASMKENFVKLIKQLMPNVDYYSFRFVSKYNNNIAVTRSVLEPIVISEDEGLMITIFNNGGFGYGATCDLTQEGISEAISKAFEWADFSKGKTTFYPDSSRFLQHKGDYYTKEQTSWNQIANKDKVDFLQSINDKLKSSPSISNWASSLRYNTMESFFVDSCETKIRQKISYILPQILVAAEHKKEVQTRTYGGHAHARQSGYDLLDDLNIIEKASSLSEEAIELSKSNNCPNFLSKALIAPDQMILQIHESIGHPLELDRILGDERNYAGSSFVTEDMFGKYMYGSDCLNVTFDPTMPTELATYNYDDEGVIAKREFLIKNGKLIKPIGGILSSQRTNLEYVACSRASSWNRPPIDRMGNINLVPGNSSFEDMLLSIENGIYLETNNSWSIDDYRNKFQFGMEYGKLIEDGKLTKTIRNPNYRAVTTPFWNKLKMVGNESTFEVFGTPNCGKGEPNQVIRVGHATPACLFEDIEVFGGA